MVGYVFRYAWPAGEREWNSPIIFYFNSKSFPHGAVMEKYSCQHNDKQRGWISTCTSIELNAALEEGYRVIELLRVLEYTKGDNQLFRPYISEFMAQKMHASGFDDSIKGNIEAEEQFIKECKENFNITIERSQMIPNKGKRALSKLALNNLCISLVYYFPYC